VFDPRGYFGDDLAGLRICVAGSGCSGVADGRVERIETDGSARTVWRQSTTDRAFAAGFGGTADDYWLSLDHENGRQVALVRVRSGGADTVTTINREANWQYVGAPDPAPDGSVAVVWLDLGAKPAAVIVPLDGGAPTFHAGNFAGFVDRSALPESSQSTPGATLPPVGEAYRLPSLDQLIAAELAMNPGEEVLGKASHEAVPGDQTTRTTDVKTIMPGGFVYLDCFGPASVTVVTGAGSTTNPCLAAGSYVIDTGTSRPITVTARGDTSWRVVVYAPAPSGPGDTEPPTPSGA
jgi:hypothetical protein